MAKLKKGKENIPIKRKYDKSPHKKYGNPNWGKKKETQIIKPESIKPESIKPESIKPDPIKPEPIKPEPIKPEPIKPDPMPEEKNTTTTDVSEAPTASEETKALPPAGDGQSSNIPKDIFSDEMPKKEILPLEGQVKDNAYSGIPNSAAPGAPQPDGSTAGGKEPPFTPQESGQPAPASGGEGTTSKVLSASEIDEKADITVDLILRAYEKIHGIGRWAGKINEDTLIELESLGKINLKRVFNIKGKEVTANQFFNEINKAIDENIVVTNDFKTTVRPILRRIVVKYKLFISDEIALVLIVAEDVSVKLSLLISYRSSLNTIINLLQDESKRAQNKTTIPPKREAQEGAASTPTQEHPEPETATNTSEWREPE